MQIKTFIALKRLSAAIDAAFRAGAVMPDDDVRLRSVVLHAQLAAAGELRPGQSARPLLVTAMARTALVCLLACVTAGAVHADGRVTVPNAVATWRIADARFARLSTDQKVAIIQVAYYRTSGDLDHMDDVTVSPAEYPALIAAIGTSSGADEATLQTGDGSPDLGAIFTLRISRWLVAHGKLQGATAEPLQGAAGAVSVTGG